MENYKRQYTEEDIKNLIEENKRLRDEYEKKEIESFKMTKLDKIIVAVIGFSLFVLGAVAWYFIDYPNIIK